MESEYYPENGNTPLLSGYDISKYSVFIGSVIWSVTLVWYSLMYELVTMSKYNATPHQGHYKAALRFVSYLQYYKKGRLVFDTLKLDVVDEEGVD